MTFKAEHKPLNETGKKALEFWTNNHDSKVKAHHDIFRVMRTLNKYFESENMTAKAFSGTDPKTHNNALLIYSGDDGDFDFEGRVLWVDGYGHGHLTDALKLLGQNCYE